MLEVESCVVALETSCGLAGAVEWDVEGRELSSPNCGRGGRGGGVPSLDGRDSALADALRDRLWIMFRVGFVKDGCCCSDGCCRAAEEALLLCCVGVVGGLCEVPAASASSITAVMVDCRQDRDVGFAVTWPDNWSLSGIRRDARYCSRVGLRPMTLLPLREDARGRGPPRSMFTMVAFHLDIHQTACRLSC